MENLESKIKELEEELAVFKAMLVCESKNNYGMFYKGAKVLELPELNSFKKYKFLVDAVDAGDASDYNKRHAKFKFISTLLANPDYIAKTDADFEAAYAIYFFEHESLSKKDLSSLARHLVIDNETYLENIKAFSQYFNTLKRNNPELKDASVRLMNEVLGAKTKKSATKQEKLERGEGLLYAWKNFTPEEIGTYPKSFDWSKIFDRWGSDNVPNDYGCYNRFNNEILEYLYPNGYLKEAMKHRFTYEIGANSPSQQMIHSFRSFTRDEEFTYTGNLPINHVVGVFDYHLEKLTSMNFPDMVSLSTDLPINILTGYANITSPKYEGVSDIRCCSYTYWHKHLLNLEFNDTCTLDRMYKFFIMFAYIDRMLDYKININFGNKKSIGEIIYETRGQAYYTAQNYMKLAAQHFTKQNMMSISDEVIKLADNIYEKYTRLLANPKTKEYIYSDKYWGEFNQKKTFIKQGYNNDIETVVNVQPLANTVANRCRMSFMIPEIWDKLEELINKS